MFHRVLPGEEGDRDVVGARKVLASTEVAMSRTDGHAPVWVHMRRGVPGVRVDHDHSRGPCDFSWDNTPKWASQPRWRRSWWPNCTIDLPFYRYPGTKYYGTTYRRKPMKRQYHGEQRARWNVIRHKLVHQDPWDVEDELGFRTRHSVLWDEW